MAAVCLSRLAICGWWVVPDSSPWAQFTMGPIVSSISSTTVRVSTEGEARRNASTRFDTLPFAVVRRRFSLAQLRSALPFSTARGDFLTASLLDQGEPWTPVGTEICSLLQILLLLLRQPLHHHHHTRNHRRARRLYRRLRRPLNRQRSPFPPHPSSRRIGVNLPALPASRAAARRQSAMAVDPSAVAAQPSTSNATSMLIQTFLVLPHFVVAMKFSALV